MSLKTKLRLLYDQIFAQYQRLQNSSSRRLPTDRFTSSTQTTDLLAVDCIIGLFRKYTECVNQELKQRKTSDDYEQLQKSLQIQEAQIRNHIRLQQQMKLYAESLQTKLQQCQKASTHQNYLHTKTIASLKKQIQKLQEPQSRNLKQKQLNSLVNTQAMRYSSKQKGYGSIRYDTENRRTPVPVTSTPTKQSKHRESNNVVHNSSSFLSRVCVPYQDLVTSSVHVRTQGDQKHRSVSREEGLRKGGMKGSSIHVITNKSNFGSHKR